MHGSGVWAGGGDPDKVASAAKEIKQTRNDALLVSEATPPTQGSDMKSSAGRFKATASNRATRWTLHELPCIEG